jgi:hypothetical protein
VLLLYEGVLRALRVFHLPLRERRLVPFLATRVFDLPLDFDTRALGLLFGFDARAFGFFFCALRVRLLDIADSANEGNESASEEINRKRIRSFAACCLDGLTRFINAQVPPLDARR